MTTILTQHQYRCHPKHVYWTKGDRWAGRCMLCNIHVDVAENLRSVPSRPWGLVLRTVHQENNGPWVELTNISVEDYDLCGNPR